MCVLFNASFPVFLFPEKGCRRPGRGKNTGLRVAAVLGGVKVRGSRFLFWRAMVGCCRRPRRGYKYGAHVRWFARQRQPSSGSAPGC